MDDTKQYMMTPNEVDFWIKEIKSCEERKKKDLVMRNNYPFLIKYYEGLQFPEMQESTMTRTERNMKKLAVINEYFPNINMLIAEIMYQNPDILVDATKPDSEEGAPIMKSALQYAFNKLDAITENRLALFDMLVAGYCAVEVNHINLDNIQTEPLAQDNTQPQSFMGKVGEALGLNKTKDVSGHGEKEIEEDVYKEIPTKEVAYSTPDETYLRRWDPLEVGFDYRADRLKDCRYLYKIIRMTAAEFNAKYPQFKDKVQAGEVVPFTMHDAEPHRKLVTLYEIQLKKADKTFVNFIINTTFKNHEIDYFVRPYTANGFNLKIGSLHDYGRLYPISMAQINKMVQDDINNYVTFMMEVAERNIPKRGYKRSVVKEDAVQALNSKKVNDTVPLDSQADVWQIPHTNVSVENKELLALFQQHKDKLWSVSQEQLGQTGDANFATELNIQQAGFTARQSDIQEGLRKLINSELDTLKDIIVQFWDTPMFFKITGQDKPSWYVPQMAPDGTVLNPLTDILTGDYEINIDISTSLKPNKERQKKELIDFATWITSPNVFQFLMSQGWTLDVEVIKKVAKEWGWNPETLLKQVQTGTLPGQVPMNGMMNPNQPGVANGAGLSV